MLVQEDAVSWQSLQTLNLSNNKVGVAGGCGLPGLLQQCRGLRELYLESCGITGEAMERGVAGALKCEYQWIKAAVV